MLPQPVELTRRIRLWSPVWYCLVTALGLLPATTASARGEPPVRTDRYGDPLPPGAIARLGMSRLWHRDRVLTVVFSPDGRTVVSGSCAGASEEAKNAIAFWDVSTGKLVRSLGGPPFAIGFLALSPDGKLLACVNGEAHVWVYDLRSGRPIRVLKPDEMDNSAIISVAFSPDGNTLAAIGGGGELSIHLWDVATGKLVRRFGDKEGGRCLAYSPDGKTLAAGGESIHLWDVTTGKELWGRPVQIGYHDLAFSPDGKVLAVGNGQALRLLAPDSGNTLRVYDGYAPAFSPDGKLLAAVHPDDTIRLRDAATGEVLRCLTGHQQGIDAVVFSPDGRTLASAGQDQTVRLWDVGTGKELYPRGGHHAPVRSVAFSPDGKTVASGGQDATVRLWDPGTSKEVRPFPKHLDTVTAVAFSLDGKTLASASEDRTIRLCDVTTGKEVRLLKGHEGETVATAYSPDGTVLASASLDGTIRLWEAATGKEQRRLEGGAKGKWVTSLAFSPDGRLLASGREDETVRLCDVRTGKEVGRLTGHESAVTAVAFSPEGRVLAAGTQDGGLRLWDAAGGKELRWCPEACVTSVAFSADGRLLATGGARDESVGLWEVASGREVGRFRGHQGAVTSVCFAPDGRRVASGSRDFTILIWDVTDLLSAAGRLTGPGLTEDQLAGSWQALADPDAAKAYRGVWRLAPAGDEAARFLGHRLTPVPTDVKERIARWVSALDDDDFTEREQATRELEKADDLAGPALWQALRHRPSGEVRKRVAALLEKLASPVPPPGRLRETRALAVLEQVGTAEARRVLRRLAEGAPEARLTQEAKASLERLARRSGPPR